MVIGFRALSRFYRRSTMGIERGTLNVLQLAFGFLAIFFAFNSQGFIEQTVVDSMHDKGKVSKNAGYISLAIIYAVFTLANFFAAPLVGLLKARWAMVFGASTYALFQAGFLFFNEPFLYISSGIIGVGAAVIWTAQGKYIALNSNADNAAKHSNLFWGVSQICITGGGIFLYGMFHDSTGDDDGISDSKIRILYSVFTAVTVVGCVILALLRMPSSEPLLESGETTENKERQLTQKELFYSTLKLLTTKRMLFLTLAFMYTGIELSFWSGIYPTCISFTKKLGQNTKSYVAFNAIAQGLGQATAGLLFGVLASKTKWLGRTPIVLLGNAVHLLVFVAVYLNFPKNAPLDKTEDVSVIKNPSLALAIACGYFLGFGDACWNTQIFSCLVSTYNKKSAEAFSLFKFFQSLLTCAAFFYGTKLELQWHMLILVVTGIVGCFGFVIAERLPVEAEEEEEDSDSRTNTVPNLNAIE